MRLEAGASRTVAGDREEGVGLLGCETRPPVEEHVDAHPRN